MHIISLYFQVETRGARMAQADIGLIGLAVMGQNLVLNMTDHGHTVCVYNRTVSKVEEFLNSEPNNSNLIGTHSLKDFVSKLRSPRKVILLVKAGNPVDQFIESLLELMEKGDVIIDGGNSNYNDTIRRTKYVEEKGLLFVGCGVSGGEEGARYGPSLMPGGSLEAWPIIKDVLLSISAKAKDGTPCCDWVGSDGAGHFVKMVHNGIEYGDMQLICEVYHLMKVKGLSHVEMANAFEKWNEGILESFLIEITRDILRFNDTDGTPLVEKIRDVAGQKGTGKWTAQSSLEYGMPTTLITEAVFSRMLSSLKADRVESSKVLSSAKPQLLTEDKEQFVKDLGNALYASKLVSYAQGFLLLRQAAIEHNWNLNFGSIASMWREGCIIRSSFLADITKAYSDNPKLSNILISPIFASQMTGLESSWRKITCDAILCSVPVPAMSSAIAFFDGLKTEKLPANLLQAQRDYFGAHTFELESKPGDFIHNNWTGRGGNITSSTYDA